MRVHALPYPICEEEKMMFHFTVQTERQVKLANTLTYLYIYQHETEILPNVN